MKFSVIIPTFNRRELLREAIESVLKQTRKDFELLVVDDGSTDGTWEMLRAIGPRIRPFGQANSGPSEARNHGARQASGDYLVFLDSDDLWMPDALQTYALALDEHGAASILRASCLEYRDRVPPVPRLGPLTSRYYRDFLEGGRHGVSIGAGKIAIRRDRFEVCGGFEPKLQCAEDYDLALRVGVDRGFVEIVAPTQVLYRRHSSLSTESIGSTLAGAKAIVWREKTAGFPGGEGRLADRQFIISQMIRPISVACIRRARYRDAWWCYFATLRWNCRLGNLKYVLGFPLLAASALLRPWSKP